MNEDPANGPATPAVRATNDDATDRWERSVLHEVALASVTERRRARRWGIFFKLLGFAYLTVVLLAGFIGKAVAPQALGKPYLKER